MNVLKMLATNSVANRSISYVTTAQDTSNSTTYTFTGVSLGTVSTNRLIVIGVYGHSTTNRTISGVKVGGVSATLVGKRDGANSNNGIYQIVNISDATADIEVTFSGTELRAAINVWALYNLSSNTAQDYGDNFTSTANSVSVTITGNSNSVAIAQSSANTTGLNVTWTNLTENNEVTLDSAVMYSAATSSSASSSLTATANWGNVINKSIVAARWF